VSHVIACCVGPMTLVVQRVQGEEGGGELCVCPMQAPGWKSVVCQIVAMLLSVMWHLGSILDEGRRVGVSSMCTMQAIGRSDDDKQEYQSFVI